VDLNDPVQWGLLQPELQVLLGVDAVAPEVVHVQDPVMLLHQRVGPAKTR
jgi:hypothetical protein